MRAKNQTDALPDVRIAAHVAPTPEWQRKLSLPNSRTYLVAHYAHDMSEAYVCLRAIRRQLRGYRRFGYPIRDLAREIMRRLPALIANAPLAVISALDVWFNPRFVKRDFDLETIIEPIPNYDSRVSLSSTRDRLGLNQVTVDWRVTGQDRLHFNALRTLLTQEMTRQGVVQLAGEPMDLAEIWPKTVVGCWHQWAQRGWTQIRRKEWSMPIAGCMEFPIFSLPEVRYSRRWAATCRRSPSWPWHYDWLGGLRLPWALRTWEVNPTRSIGQLVPRVKT
jgi:hypothetical protein